MTNRSGNPVTKNTELSIMNRLLSEMQNHASSWPFREPVKLSDAVDYYDVIEQPMGTFSSLVSLFTEAENFFSSLRRFENHGREAEGWQIYQLGRIYR
jgi:Bromodomain